MTIVTKMKKIDIINIMLDNNYPEAWAHVPSDIRRRKSVDECRAKAVNILQYHVLKQQVYEMFRDYLYWKIEQ